ncbi:MAG: glycosyltransferase, partial [Candidatus Verstraetearchaeota archaeon]|nr:glycosyltransferase [Candidatus Verstraetearchaeota archaeon]
MKIDENYRPKVTVILPTYNEAGIIWEKLDDIYRQDYPKKLLKIVVVDSASADGTPDIVKKWADIHPDVHLSILQEPVRRGMVP